MTDPTEPELRRRLQDAINRYEQARFRLQAAGVGLVAAIVVNLVGVFAQWWRMQ